MKISMTTEQRKLLMSITGLRDQIGKSHFLNAHFRAFEIARDCWKEHVRMNALSGSRACNSPAGAVLDDERDDTPNAHLSGGTPSAPSDCSPSGGKA